MLKRIVSKKANQQNIKEDEILISADTIIIFNNTIIGKPTSYEDAKKYFLFYQITSMR